VATVPAGFREVGGAVAKQPYLASYAHHGTLQ
jgi:hypothetical protein